MERQRITGAVARARRRGAVKRIKATARAAMRGHRWASPRRLRREEEALRAWRRPRRRA